MKSTHLSHVVLAAVAYLAGLYGPTTWSLLSRGGEERVTATSAISTLGASMHCHGLRRYPEKNLLFTSCRDGVEDGRGRRPSDLFHIFDPKASTTTKLNFENFKGPLIVQSFDVVADPDNTGAVYIHAVNHIPTGSQIEVFRHILGASTIQHVRSVKHPVVSTPSNLVASSPLSFFITNGHADNADASSTLSEGYDDAARWSSVLHVEIGNLEATMNPSRSVTTSIAFTSSAEKDLQQGLTEEELDYPLEWLTGDDVPECALSAQKSVSSSRLMKLRDCVRLAAGLGSPGF